MRTITTKDKRGLLIAFRIFLRAMSGERLSQQAGGEVIERALGAGLTFDELLNKENWGRALAVVPNLTAKEYVDVLSERRIDVKEIKEEPMWHDISNGFVMVAEAAHDFFLEVSGRGGKWNIPSALTNLAKAIREHSLQAILSEKLIEEVTFGDSDMTYFGYLDAIVKDFDSLSVDTSLTDEQARRREEDETTVKAATTNENQHEEEAPAEKIPAVDEEYEQPEDTPYPEGPGEDDELNAVSHFETMFVAQNTPREMKRDGLRLVLVNYTPSELLGLVKTIEGGENMYITDIIDFLTDGRFDTAAESAETKKIHQNISADLMPMFIDCVHSQNIEMDDKLASNYDILKDSWDLRTPQVRKLHKLKKLIVTYGLEDQDLMEAIGDIEELYSE